MHAQPAFRMTGQNDMAAFIAARRFATLVVAGPDRLQAAHIPMILHTDDAGAPRLLEGHVARNNPVAAIATGTRALAIFRGPDAYVTPALYPTKREHGRVVPTWNYIAVEVSGRVEAFTDAADLRRQIEALTDMMEGDADAPWAVSDAPDDYIAKMINGITGLRLHVETVEGVRKLSQNRAEADRAGVIAGFSHSTDAAARALANEMTKEPPRK